MTLVTEDVFVLSTSFGAWSAGTRVDMVLDNEVFYFAIGNEKVPAEFVVQRRTRAMLVPKINSRERRRRERQVKKELGIDG